MRGIPSLLVADCIFPPSSSEVHVHNRRRLLATLLSMILASVLMVAALQAVAAPLRLRNGNVEPGTVSIASLGTQTAPSDAFYLVQFLSLIHI